jgi:hypothetical protein
MGNHSLGSGLSSNHSDQEIVGEPLKKKLEKKMCMEQLKVRNSEEKILHFDN